MKIVDPFIEGGFKQTSIMTGKDPMQYTGWFLISVPCLGIYKSIVLWSNRAQILDT